MKINTIKKNVKAFKIYNEYNNNNKILEMKNNEISRFCLSGILVLFPSGCVLLIEQHEMGRI